MPMGDGAGTRMSLPRDNALAEEGDLGLVQGITAGAGLAVRLVGLAERV